MSDQDKRNAMIQAVKDALMVEIKGQQLYSHAATTATDPEVKAMFQMLANDEENHVQMLEAQFKPLMEEGKITLDGFHPAELDHGSQGIIPDGFKKSIKRGDFEMAIIGIGCNLEVQAIAHYKSKAKNIEDPDLKQLFTWLAEWEEDHLAQLRELEGLYQDAYWADQGFSPM